MQIYHSSHIKLVFTQWIVFLGETQNKSSKWSILAEIEATFKNLKNKRPKENTHNIWI